MMRCVSDRCREGRIDCPTPELCDAASTGMTTWKRFRDPTSPSDLFAMYRRLRRPIIWKLDKSGQIVTAQSTRGRLAALVALWKYWRAPVPF